MRTFRVSVERHHESEMHRLSCEMERDEAQQATYPQAVRTQEQRAREALKRLFTMLLLVTKRKHSLQEYEHLIKLLGDCGVDVGDRNHSRKAASEMAPMVVDVIKEQLRRWLATKNPRMGCKPHVSVAADKATNQFGLA